MTPFGYYIRITSWAYRFFENCKRKMIQSGPSKTNETEKAKVFWTKHEQGKVETTENFKEDQGLLNLQKNGTEIYKCRERIQGYYPLYIARKSLLAEKITYEPAREQYMGESYCDNGCYQGKLLDS